MLRLLPFQGYFSNRFYKNWAVLFGQIPSEKLPMTSLKFILSMILILMIMTISVLIIVTLLLMILIQGC